LAKELLMRRWLVLWLVMASACGAAFAGSGPIRIGITPAIVHDHYPAMMALRHYLEARTGRVIDLVPRDSYRDTIDMIKRGELDFAWVSAFPYVYAREHFKARLVAVPVLNGRPTFRAYLLVPASDRRTNGLMDLRGKIFAYADPYSHGGYVVPRYELQQANIKPEQFFARTFFTLGHRNSIRAVAAQLADGGYVDSYVWDSLSAIQPELTAATRVAARSPEYGAPPMIAAGDVSDADVSAMRAVLVGMATDAEGAKLLTLMHVDRFIAGDPNAYSEVERMMRAIGVL
jgi:phosphonate transport system substrate-binding protein